MRRSGIEVLALLCSAVMVLGLRAQEPEVPSGFTRQDVLRGSITEERSWWDVQHYELSVEFFPETKRIAGSNAITFTALADGSRMQVDLQPPLAVTRVSLRDEELEFEREGNVYWVTLADPIAKGESRTVTVSYEGRPLQSSRPPWSGGLSWRRDRDGDPFIATTCQGIGASIWWPNKDHGYDEPDRGMDIRATVPEALTAVANGRLVEVSADEEAETRTFHWRVTNPINNYCVNINVAKYVSIQSTYEGEAGQLDLEYWVLESQREDAERQFAEVPRTLEAFEHWFGAYPFYEDSYKLVVVPYLGMEHQSSVTYGNGFRNGYRGRDLSGTGVGLKFDFIIVHESAHEWWGNNVSMVDVADMWIHESFANYAENLFVDYHFSSEEAADYVIGCRALIQNDRPIIGTYGVNNSGSGDMYYKGGNMLHTMRMIVDDDDRWRGALRGINEQFRHRTVATDEIESFLSERCDFDFGPLFDQYLRTTDIPLLVQEVEGKQVALSFEDVVEGFEIPVRITVGDDVRRVLVGSERVVVDFDVPIESIEVDRSYYIRSERR